MQTSSVLQYIDINASGDWFIGMRISLKNIKRKIMETMTTGKPIMIQKCEV